MGKRLEKSRGNMLLTCGGVAACHARRTNGIQAAHERHTRGVTGTLARRPYDGLHAAEKTALRRRDRE